MRKVSPALPGLPPRTAENGRMLIMLPPSETKTRPSEVDGAPLDLDAMSLPQLGGARATMLRAAQRTAAGPEAAAHLGVPASAPELVGRMLHLEQEPTAPPLTVYSGVLYDQLAPDLVPVQDRDVLIQSALFGLVDAFRDRIPAYRLSSGSSLSRLGKAGSWWGKQLRPLASELCAAQARSASPLVIDCRSGGYRSMMSLRSGDGVRVLDVAPVQERAGVRKVISHDAKRYRGLVTQVLLDLDRAPTTAEDVVEAVGEGLDGQLRVELDGDRLLVVDHAS
ncbi:MAG: peroxide stress protein YaaA [Brachybacterium sp.]|nr:peroxide stress protein YaaA [Brachybacterium sp.]